MSGTVQTSAKMKTRREFQGFVQIRSHFDSVMNKSHPGVEVAVKAAMGALQGGVLGYVMGALMKSSADTLKEGAAANPMMSQMQGTMTPMAQAKGLAALCGVSSGISAALKKMRNGKEDIWSQMGAAAGGGAAFTIANGNYTIPAVVNSALVLGLFTGAVTKVMDAFKPQHEETEFQRSKFLLQSLGLSKYEKNLKRGQLTDDTIMLWTDSALQEVRIPPGPRLLILHHLDQLRQWQAKTEPKRSSPRPSKSEGHPISNPPVFPMASSESETSKPE